MVERGGQPAHLILPPHGSAGAKIALPQRRDALLQLLQIASQAPHHGPGAQRDGAGDDQQRRQPAKAAERAMARHRRQVDRAPIRQIEGKAGLSATTAMAHSRHSVAVRANCGDHLAVRRHERQIEAGKLAPALQSVLLFMTRGGRRRQQAPGDFPHECWLGRIAILAIQAPRCCGKRQRQQDAGEHGDIDAQIKPSHKFRAFIDLALWRTHSRRRER